MLSPPDNLTDADVVSALAAGWGLVASSVSYRPLGFGSHHWEVHDASGARWFATVDELDTRRHSRAEPLSLAFDRLGASLGAARALADLGHDFVVAPVPAPAGAACLRLGERFSIALYPFVDGQSYSWGEFPTAAHRRAVLDLLVTVHAAPITIAHADDFTIPHRDELTAALAGAAANAGWGPYAEPAARLVADHTSPLTASLDRYDQLVAAGRTEPSRLVLTHGEPHPGNTMLTAAGWRLIDWDTALTAPPERDLWSLDPGDGSVLAAYAAVTGVTPLATMLELYRLRWDLADVAVDVSRFRRPHGGNSDDEKTFAILQALLASLSL